jgi:hypothetical protein
MGEIIALGAAEVAVVFVPLTRTAAARRPSVAGRTVALNLLSVLGRSTSGPDAGAGGNQLCVGGERGRGDGLPFVHPSIQGQGQHLGSVE